MGRGLTATGSMRCTFVLVWWLVGGGPLICVGRTQNSELCSCYTASTKSRQTEAIRERPFTKRSPRVTFKHPCGNNHKCDELLLTPVTEWVQQCARQPICTAKGNSGLHRKDTNNTKSNQHPVTPS